MNSSEVKEFIANTVDAGIASVEQQDALRGAWGASRTEADDGYEASGKSRSIGGVLCPLLWKRTA